MVAYLHWLVTRIKQDPACQYFWFMVCLAQLLYIRLFSMNKWVLVCCCSFPECHTDQCSLVGPSGPMPAANLCTPLPPWPVPGLLGPSHHQGIPALPLGLTSSGVARWTFPVCSLLPCCSHSAWHLEVCTAWPLVLCVCKCVCVSCVRSYVWAVFKVLPQVPLLQGHHEASWYLSICWRGNWSS